MRKYKATPINVQAGVNPEPDSTESGTPFWVSSSKARFYNGRLRSLGGRSTVLTDVSVITCNRNVFSYHLSNKNRYIIGGANRLYEMINNQVVNITPQVTSTTTAIANSLATDYNTLGNNALLTLNGSNVVTVLQFDHKMKIGDTFTLAGISGAVNGIPDNELNVVHTVRNVSGVNNYTFAVNTEATSGGFGGGASMITSSGVIRVTDSSHGLSDGDRVTIASATAVSDITAAQINTEHIIRKIDDHTYDIATSGMETTASVTGGGGASTTRASQISEGSCDVEVPDGYGAGLYGQGLYGDNQDFSTPAYPRIWSVDRFGDNIVLTPGQQMGVYEYDSDNSSAPTVVSNAPATVNGLVVHKNQIVTWGKSGIGNQIDTCDIGDRTDWTPAAGSEAFSDVIEGAEEFISAAVVQDYLVLFTRNQVWQQRYVGKPVIRTTKRLDATDGIIGPMAWSVVGEKCYFMGVHDIYVTDGVDVVPIPNNTLRRWVFDNINDAQAWKSFSWVNRTFNEWWLHFPFGASTEPDYVLRYNYITGEFSQDTSDITAVESPLHITENPLAVSNNQVLWRLESGDDDDTSAQTSSAETNYFQLGNGDNSMYIMGYVHDAIQTGNLYMTVFTKRYPDDTDTRTFGPYILTPTTQKVNFRAYGRLAKVRFEKSDVGASFMLGNPKLLLQVGYTR